MNKRIFIDGTEIDVGDIGFTLTFSIMDVKDPTLHKAFKSSTISVPATSKNLAVFGHIDVIGAEYKTGFTADLVVGLFTLRGDVIVFGYEVIGRKRYIQFQIVSNSIAEKLKGVMLSDLDLSSGNHTITVANVNSSPTTYLKYGLFDHGYGFKIENNNCYVVERHAGINIENLVAKIISKAGYGLTASLNSDHYLFDFSKLLINDANFEDDKLCEAAGTYSLLISLTSLQVYTLNVNEVLSFTESVDTGGNFASSAYTIPAAGSYKFDVGFSFGYICTLVTITSTMTVTIEIRNGTTVVASEAKSFTATTGTHTFAVSTSYYNFSKDDVIKAYIKITGVVTADDAPNANFRVNIGSGTLDVKADPRRGINYSLTVSELLPSTSCLDFLKDYMTLQNMFMYINENTKVVTLGEMGDFYTGDLMDWTDKLVLEKSIKIEKLSRPERVVVGYTVDNNDLVSKNTTDFSTTEKEFTEYEEDEQSIIVSFARTKIAPAWRYGLSSIDMPIIEGDKSYKFLWRILEYNPETASWTFEGSTVTTFPAFNENDLTPAQIKARYSGYFTNLEQSKVLTATFRLTDYDIYNIINFTSGACARTYVQLKQPEFYGKYAIQEISKWDADTQEATVILLQVNDK